MDIEYTPDEMAESEYMAYGTKLPTIPPSDFKHGVFKGKFPRLGKVDLVRGETDDVKYVKWVEVITHMGRAVLNGTTPMGWGYIAKVHYGIFSYPMRIEMNPEIPENVREIVLPLLEKELL
jgi:hypothetical protein|nr:MAG TPA: hypothetical protein [Caudoviricetes sp.]